MSLSRDFDQPCRYLIRIGGHLDESWSEWFEGLLITSRDDGTTELNGIIADQAALYGLLNKLRDMTLTLISLAREGDAPATRDMPQSSGSGGITGNPGSPKESQ
jgi:hypothetical protein